MALGDVIARLSVQLGLDTAAFEKGATLSEKRLAQSAKRFEKIGASIGDLGKKLSIGLTVPLAAFGVSAVKAAQESQDAIGQVEAALASMGNAAGRTSEQLQGLATGLMKQSLFDDDEILRKVTANLLTFGKVSGEQFDRAQLAAVNLSARLGQDLQSSAIQVGKALNDPIKGVTALQRVGVSFTAAQKEQIKTLAETGQVAKAQGIILDELNNQFGGAAEAARKNNPFAVLKQSFAEFQETVGAQLVKALPPITDAITGILEAFNGLSPGVQKVIVVVGVLAAAFGPVLIGLGALISAAAPLLAAFTGIAGAIGGFSGILIATVSSLAGLVVALAPVLIPLAAVAAAATAAYLAFKYWDKIVAFIKPVTDVLDSFTRKVESTVKAIPGYIRDMVSAIAAQITGRLSAIWEGAKAKVEQVKRIFANLYDAVVGHSYIPDMVDGIADQMARLDRVMVAQAGRAASATEDRFREMAAKIAPLLDRLFPDAQRLRQFERKMADAVNAAAIGVPGAKELVAGLFAERDAEQASAGIEKGISAFDRFTQAANATAEKVRATNVRIVKSFKDMADETLGALDRLAGAIKGGGFLDILSAVIGLGTQLASIGAFGKKVQARVNVPARALGGPINSGSPYLVGERGPELVVPRNNGTVIPNGRFGGGAQRLDIRPSPLFEVYVDGKLVRAAPSIAEAGAQVAQRRSARAQTRRVA